MKSCNCKSGASNTGVPFCVDIYGRTKQPILQSIYDSDGNKNSIKDSDFVNGVLPAAYIQSMINHIDPSKRWFVLPEAKNFIWTQAEPTTEDVDGIPLVASEGNITGSFDMLAQNASDKYYGVLESFKCGKFGIIPVTVNGEIVGVEGVDELYPQPIEAGTMYLTKAIGTKSVVNKITVNFMYQEDFPIADINYISSENIETGALDGLNGLRDIYLAENDAATTTTVSFKASLSYNTFNSENSMEGLEVDDLTYDEGTTTSTVFNVTTGLPIALDSLAESSVQGEEGEYVATWTTPQTSADVVRVAILKNGFDAEYIDITIP